MRLYKKPTQKQLKTLKRFKHERNFRSRFLITSGKIDVMYSSKDKFGDTYMQTTIIHRNGNFKMNELRLIR